MLLLFLVVGAADLLLVTNRSHAVCANRLILPSSDRLFQGSNQAGSPIFLAPLSLSDLKVSGVSATPPEIPGPARAPSPRSVLLKLFVLIWIACCLLKCSWCDAKVKIKRLLAFTSASYANSQPAAVTNSRFSGRC